MPAGRKEQQSFIDRMCRNKDIHFSRPQIEKLMYKFDEVVRSQGMKDKSPTKLSRDTFRDMILFKYFGMTDDILMDRVFRAFDRDLDNAISREEWVTGLSSMLSGPDICEPKAKFAFFVYDLNGDGYISREEMYQLLKNSLTTQQTEDDKDEQIKDLVEIAMKKMDVDHDGRISYNDFLETIKGEELLREVLGPCFPNNQKAAAFMNEIDSIKMRH